MSVNRRNHLSARHCVASANALRAVTEALPSGNDHGRIFSVTMAPLISARGVHGIVAR